MGLLETCLQAPFALKTGMTTASPRILSSILINSSWSIISHPSTGRIGISFHS
jgi:hypothetical protein